MNKKLFAAALTVLSAAVYSLPAFSQAKPETLVKQRQSAMVLQAKYFYAIRPMAQGKIPYDANIVARNAGYLEVLTKLAWDGFTPNTKDVKSGATPAVFTDTAKFKESQDRLQSDVAKLASMSKSGDEAAVKAQIMAVNKTCDSCHESFREKQ